MPIVYYIILDWAFSYTPILRESSLDFGIKSLFANNDGSLPLVGSFPSMKLYEGSSSQIQVLLSSYFFNNLYNAVQDEIVKIKMSIRLEDGPSNLRHKIPLLD